MRSMGDIFAALPFAGQFVGDVDIFDALILSQDAQGGGVGGELIVGVGEVGVFLVVQRQHGFEVDVRLRFRPGNDLVEKRHVLRGLLAEHHEHGALDVVAFLERGFGFRGDGPGRRHPQPGGPEDERQVGPNPGVLVGEHNDLKPVVGHVGGEVPVGIHHALPELLAGSREWRGHACCRRTTRGITWADVFRTKREQPDPPVAEQFVELRTGHPVADRVCGRVQDQDHRDRPLDIGLEPAPDRSNSGVRADRFANWLGVRLRIAASMSEQQNEIDSATTTLATKMVTWLSPLTQAVGQNIDLPRAAANSGLRSCAFRAEVAEFPRIRAVAGWAPPSATPRILANSATRNFEDSGGCDPVARWMIGRRGARFATGRNGAAAQAVEPACGQSTAHRGSLSDRSQSQWSILPALANVYQ